MQASKHANSTQKSPSRLVDSKTRHSCCEAHVKSCVFREVMGQDYFLAGRQLLLGLSAHRTLVPVTLVQSQVACFQLFSIFTPSHTQLSKAKLDRHNHLTLSNTYLFQNVDILFNFFIAPHNKDLGVSCVSACVISLTSLRNITGNTVSFRVLVLLLKVQQKYGW